MCQLCIAEGPLPDLALTAGRRLGGHWRDPVDALTPEHLIGGLDPGGAAAKLPVECAVYAYSFNDHLLLKLKECPAITLHRAVAKEFQTKGIAEVVTLILDHQGAYGILRQFR